LPHSFNVNVNANINTAIVHGEYTTSNGPVQRRKIGNPKWEFTVGYLARRENQAVARAIHRFQAKVVGIGIRVVITTPTRGDQKHVLLRTHTNPATVHTTTTVTEPGPRATL
jgi:hypothetical protein